MKRNIALVASLSLILLSLFLISLGCGSVSSSGGNGSSPTPPAVHTIYSSSDASSTLMGLVIQGTNVFVAFETNSKRLCLLKSTNEGDSFYSVTCEANGTNGRIRAAINDNSILYIPHRYYDGTHYFGMSSIEAASATSFDNGLVFSIPRVVGCLDIATSGPSFFLPYTADGEVRFVTNAGFSGIFTGDTGGLNEGGLSGQWPGAATLEVAHVNYYPSVTPSTELVFHVAHDVPTCSWIRKVLVATNEVVRNIDIESAENWAGICFYKGQNLYTMFSDDSGDTWSTPKLIAAADNDMTSMAFSTTYANCVFIGENQKDVRLARSTDGINWTVQTLVSTDTVSDKYPEIQASGNTIIIIYRTGDGIFMLRSLDDGASWT